MVKKVLVVVLAIVAVVLLADVAYIGTLLFSQDANQLPTVSDEANGPVSLYNPYNSAQTTSPSEQSTLGSPYNPQTLQPTRPPVLTTNPTESSTAGEQPTQQAEQPTSQQVSTPQADSYSLEQVITAMNNAIAYVENGKNFTAYKTQTGNAEILELSFDWLRPIGQEIIQHVLDSIEPLTYQFKNGTAVDPKTGEIVRPMDVIPPSGELFSVNPAGVTAYSATRNTDGSTTYTVKIREEVCNLEDHPPYHGTCMGYLKLEQFDLRGAKIDSGVVTYHEGQIDITVGADGLPMEFYEYLPISGDGAGSLAGITATAKMTGYLTETWTFTW